MAAVPVFQVKHFDSSQGFQSVVVHWGQSSVSHFCMVTGVGSRASSHRLLSTLCVMLFSLTMQWAALICVGQNVILYHSGRGLTTDALGVPPENRRRRKPENSPTIPWWSIRISRSSGRLKPSDDYIYIYRKEKNERDAAKVLDVPLPSKTGLPNASSSAVVVSLSAAGSSINIRFTLALLTPSNAWNGHRACSLPLVSNGRHVAPPRVLSRVPPAQDGTKLPSLPSPRGEYNACVV